MAHSPIIRDCTIRDVTFGENVTIVQPVNLYECRIGGDSFIGPFVEIQAGAVIGKRCKIQSHVFICDLVSIGDDVFVSHGVMFINDPFQIGHPAGSDRSHYRNTVIGDHVSIGTNSTILPVTIVDHAVIGAGSVVTEDITEAAIYAGNPARRIRDLPDPTPLNPDT